MAENRCNTLKEQLDCMKKFYQKANKQAPAVVQQKFSRKRKEHSQHTLSGSATERMSLKGRRNI